MSSARWKFDHSLVTTLPNHIKNEELTEARLCWLFVEYLADPLGKWLVPRIGTPHLADDAVTFAGIELLKYYQKGGLRFLDGVNTIGQLTDRRRRMNSLLVFVNRAAWHRAIRLDKRQKRQRRLKGDYCDQEAKDPSTTVEQKETMCLVHTALDRLLRKHRMVLILYHFDDLSYQDIAEVMGTTRKAVKSLLARARTTFAEAMRRLGTADFT